MRTRLVPTLATLLIFCSVALADTPPLRPLGSSPAPLDTKRASIDELANEITGLMSVHPAYDADYCQVPRGLRLLRPRIVGKRVAKDDPVARIEGEMTDWVGTWIGMMMNARDGAARAGAGEPWYRAPVCVGLYDDVDAQGQPAMNAMATSERNILFGRRMYDAVVRGGFGGNRAAGLVYVLAHEFGHYLQFRAGLRFSYETAAVRELQADCLAGYVMALTPMEKPTQAGFIQRTFELAAALGDDLVHAPDHHGTSEQRVYALRTGYAQAARAAQAFHQQHPGARFYLHGIDALNACSAWPSDQQRAP